MDATELEKHRVTDDENRGLKWSLYAGLGYILLIVALTFPQGSFFRADNGNILPSSPFLSSIAGILFFLFFFMGVAYGYGAKIIKEGSDIPKMMERGLKGGISFLVVVLPAAIFIHLFNASNLATILAVNGADWLKSMDLTGSKLIIAFVLLTTTINLFISSGSAKWLILAPIFVPMLGMMGFSPALTQAAYRVGDSCTNNIAPLSYYVPVMLGFYEQYKQDAEQEVGKQHEGNDQFAARQVHGFQPVCSVHGKYGCQVTRIEKVNEDCRWQNDHKEADAAFEPPLHHLGNIRSFLDDFCAVPIGYSHHEEQAEKDARYAGEERRAGEDVSVISPEE